MAGGEERTRRAVRSPPLLKESSWRVLEEDMPASILLGRGDPDTIRVFIWYVLKNQTGLGRGVWFALIRLGYLSGTWF